MRIATKIAIGYLILVVLLAGVLAYEYVVILELQQSTIYLYETYYQAGLQTTRLLSELYEIESLVRKYFLTRGDPDYQRSLSERAGVASARLTSILDINLPEREAQAFRRLEQSWGRFREALERSMTTLEGGRALMQEEGRVIFLMEKLLEEAHRLRPLTDGALLAKIESSNSSIEQVRTLVWMGGAIALAAGLLVGVLVVRSITRPIDQLTRATRKISKGDLRVQVAEGGSDEVGELARHFNLMVRRLGESSHDELKSDFVSRVSHELKAPMASIQETTSLLLERFPGPLNASQDRLLMLNRDSGARLSRMINELLQLSSLESGMERYLYERLDFVALVRTVIDEIRPICRERGTGLELLPAEERMTIECDSDKMIQVVRNLVDNAIKFSPAQATIRISLGWESQIPESLPVPLKLRVACPAGRFLLLSVRDRGPGVKNEEKERIFDKFQQSERPPDRAGRGVGLGLAIARHIVQEHAGAIWVVDHAGGGSDFQVLICHSRARGFSPPFARSA